MQGNIVSLAQTMAAAPPLLPQFERAAAQAPYEDKGVLFSEMFFVLAAVAHLRPARIFESGRARGVSTWLLGNCFPESQIVSVEFDAQSADVPIAKRHLQGLKNVECLFGDAQKLLPERVQAGDVVLIDGPKHFRALRLAFRLLRERRPAAVFIHDCHLGSCERDFLAPHVPGTFYSDDAAYVAGYRHLDDKCWDLRKGLGTGDFPSPGLFRGLASSYGPTFACLPGNLQLSGPGLSLRLFLAGIQHRLHNSMAKASGRTN